MKLFHPTETPAPRVILSQNPGTSIAVGNLVTFTCTALVVNYLAVPPIIEWQTPDGKLEGDTLVPRPTGNGVYLVYTNMLSYLSAQPHLGGEYRCNVTINVNASNVPVVSTVQAITLRIIRKFILQHVM